MDIHVLCVIHGACSYHCLCQINHVKEKTPHCLFHFKLFQRVTDAISGVNLQCIHRASVPSNYGWGREWAIHRGLVATLGKDRDNREGGAGVIRGSHRAIPPKFNQKDYIHKNSKGEGLISPTAHIHGQEGWTWGRAGRALQRFFKPTPSLGYIST